MLPYTTLQETETALNRSLTTAETLWFNYSANKSDYLLYCHSLLIVFLLSTLIPLFYITMELIFPDYMKSYKIQPNVKPSLYEHLKCYLRTMRTFFLIVLPMQLNSYGSIQMIGIRTGLPLPSLMEIVAQLTVYLIIEDYTNYWLHRLFPYKWFYEKIHKVHHEYTTPTGFSTRHTHWAEIMVFGIPAILGPAIVPGHMITYWLWIALDPIEDTDNHTGYDLPWTFKKLIPFSGGAEYHDYHHYIGGKGQGNYAPIFTYCDNIYGTDKGYRYRKKLLKQLKEGSKSECMQKQNGGSNASGADVKSE